MKKLKRDNIIEVVNNIYLTFLFLNANPMGIKHNAMITNSMTYEFT